MKNHLENNVLILYNYETIKLNLDDIVKYHQEFDFKTLIVILHSEKNLDSLENGIQIFSYLNEKNIKCFWVYSGIEGNFTLPGFENITIVSWPTSQLHVILRYESLDLLNTINKNVTNGFEKLYLNLNNTDKYHRVIMMDYLAQYNLLDDGLISWNKVDRHKQNNVVKTKKWITKLEIIDPFFRILNNNNFVHTYNNNFYPKIIDKFFIELVTESEENTDLIRYTEKTWKPILYGKPFITYSGEKYYNNLQKLGFYLYDEIINYDFDEISLSDYDLKPQKICEILLNLKNRDLNELHNSIHEKLLKNKQNAIEIYKKNKYIDQEFIKFLEIECPIFYKEFFQKKIILI